MTVFGGTAGGLAQIGREITAAPEGVAGTSEEGDRLGVAVAAGDTNGDDIDDLAIGIPGEDAPDIGFPVSADAGAVLVLRGRTATGVRPGLQGDSVELHLDDTGVAGTARAGDQLGITVAVGDVHGDGFVDIVAGAVGKDVGAARDAGSVVVLRGSADGVRARGSRSSPRTARRWPAWPRPLTTWAPGSPSTTSTATGPRTSSWASPARPWGRRPGRGRPGAARRSRRSTGVGSLQLHGLGLGGPGRPS